MSTALKVDDAKDGMVLNFAKGRERYIPREVTYLASPLSSLFESQWTVCGSPRGTLELFELLVSESMSSMFIHTLQKCATSWGFFVLNGNEDINWRRCSFLSCRNSHRPRRTGGGGGFLLNVKSCRRKEESVAKGGGLNGMMGNIFLSPFYASSKKRGNGSSILVLKANDGEVGGCEEGPLRKVPGTTFLVDLDRKFYRWGGVA